MTCSAERVQLFAQRCADLGKKLGVDVVDLYTLFHANPVSFQIPPVLRFRLSHFDLMVCLPSSSQSLFLLGLTLGLVLLVLFFSFVAFPLPISSISE